MKLFAAIIAALLLGVAHAGPGDPIPGTEVGLEHDPEGIIAPRPTDREGNVVFTGLERGRYTVFIPDASRIEAPMGIRVSVEGSTLRVQDYTVQPGRGRAYALDANGQRLVVEIPRGDGRVTVNVSTIFDRWGRADRPRQ